MDEVASQIRASLVSQSLPPPSHAWLMGLLSSRPRPLPPLLSLTATAKSRLLAADLTSPNLLDPAGAASLPSASPDVPEARLPRDVVVQVLDIENLSRSRWEQVEELEAVARGELSKGRQIVRLREDAGGDDGDGQGDVPPEEQPENAARPVVGFQAPAAASDKKATHRLVVQDCRGQRLFALELSRIERIGLGKTNIGEKLLLRAGTVVARGTVLLEPEKCTVLGGKIEAWNKPWIDGRLARLKEAAATAVKDAQ